MGWLNTNIVAVKEESDKPPIVVIENKPEKEAESDAAAVDSNNQENQKLEVLQVGSARIISEWPLVVTRFFLWLVLGITLSLLLVLLVRLAMPLFVQPERAPQPLHLATTNLTISRACAVEALAKEHAHRPCHLVVLRSHPAPAIRMIYQLRNKYPNLNTHYHADPDDFFEGSPFDGFFKLGGSNSLMELAARTLALWRHGGISVDLDKPMMQFPPWQDHVQQGHGALLQFPEPCHPALQGLLDAVSKDAYSSSEEAITRANDWICNRKGDDELMTPERCLGVNILKGEGLSCDQLQCPVVRDMHATTTEGARVDETTVKSTAPMVEHEQAELVKDVDVQHDDLLL